MKKKIKKFKVKFQIERSFVFIEAPIADVGPQAMLWGEARWWPGDCALRFVRIGEQDPQLGTRYLLKQGRAKGLGWEMEVTKWEANRIVERTFRSGMLKGHELLRIGERSNGTRVDYELSCWVQGLLNRLLWALFLRKKYKAAVDTALKSLRDYCLKEQEQYNAEEPLEK